LEKITSNLIMSAIGGLADIHAGRELSPYGQKRKFLVGSDGREATK